MAMDIKLGQVVVSTAGRDKGRYFIVCQTLNENYVNVCDGYLRKIRAPKKKNMKHLKILPYRLKGIADRLARNAVDDAQIRKALSEFVK
jgi:large subunit ribosomal protein L14e